MSEGKPGKGRKRGWMGRVIGLLIVVGAVIAVFTVKREIPPVEAPPVVRPLKTITVGAAYEVAGREFPGRVKAGESAILSFEVAGTVQELLVRRGEKVETDQFLARLDPQDYQNELQVAQAELERARAQRDRIRAAYEKNAVSQQDLTNAEAQFSVAEAQVSLRQTAVDHTRLRAPFPGAVARIDVDPFETVQAKQPVLVLQDVTSVDIQIQVPEGDIARTRDAAERARFAASFDYLPGREFELAVKEFETEADPITQTYAVTFTMPQPEDANILPGMTATVTIRVTRDADGAGAGFLVPLNAVPIDEAGGYFAWKVLPESGDLHRVTRQRVRVGPMTADGIVVTEGLNRGDILAAAGVNLLAEGQKVTLYGSVEGAR